MINTCETSTLGRNLQIRITEEYNRDKGEIETYTSYHLPKNEKYFETYEEYESNRDSQIDENTDAVGAVIERYRHFRSIIKAQLFI